MIKFENEEVFGWEAAARGMRNPMNSWSKGDTEWTPTKIEGGLKVDTDFEEYNDLQIGPNDQNLMIRLRKAGTDHRKFMRMIVVWVDITAPLYWWKEFDTYKVGTVANSCSTMHKIADKEFTMEDFSCEHLLARNDWDDCCSEKTNWHDLALCDYGDVIYAPKEVLGEWVIPSLNAARRIYLETKDKKYWWQMIQLLPSSYNQIRTVMLNYEVLANIYPARKDHKLDEWHSFCRWIESLPFAALITGGGG